jgi:hypothetical protein
MDDNGWDGFTMRMMVVGDIILFKSNLRVLFYFERRRWVWILFFPLFAPLPGSLYKMI